MLPPDIVNISMEQSPWCPVLERKLLYLFCIHSSKLFFFYSKACGSVDAIITRTPSEVLRDGFTTNIETLFGLASEVKY